MKKCSCLDNYADDVDNGGGGVAADDDSSEVCDVDDVGVAVVGWWMLMINEIRLSGPYNTFKSETRFMPYFKIRRNLKPCIWDFYCLRFLYHKITSCVLNVNVILVVKQT